MGKKSKASSVAPSVAPCADGHSSDSESMSEDVAIEGNDASLEVANRSDGGKHFECEICHFNYQSCDVVNAGTKEYPHWRCKQCHNASRWLDKTYRSKGWDVAEYKRTKWSIYCKHTLQFRLWTRRCPPELKDAAPDGKKGRYVAWVVFEEAMQFEIFNEDSTSIAFLTFRQWVGYYKIFECYTEQEAKDLWNAALQAPEYKEKKIDKVKLFYLPSCQNI